MKRILILLLPLLITFSHAQSGLKYSTVTIDKGYTSPKNNADTVVTFYLKYLKFEGSGTDSKIADKLNTMVTEITTDEESPVMNNFDSLVASYKEFLNDIGDDDWGGGFYVNKQLEYSTPTEGIGNFTYSVATYLGGAHGGFIIGYSNFSFPDLKPIHLDDVLVAGYSEKLTKLGEKIFRDLKGLTADFSLEGSYWFKDDKFHLNDNYIFTKTGISFLYNEYEIASYAEGITEFEIPYSAIKDLIKKDGPLAKFAK
ncbi:MAG: DUF3298 domain-containing protein [Ignavibacteria bacterium]|nr:DUF3298 domain-containing protein [Ignavibacteria bacterium]